MQYKIKYFSIEIKEPSVQDITRPSNIFKYLKDEFSPIQESLWLIGMNIKNKILLKKEISKGSVNCLATNPAEIFRFVLISGCTNFILAHNHPSGDTTPSAEDIDFSKKIVRASSIMGLNFLDNLVFTDKDFYSFKTNSLM